MKTIITFLLFFPALVFSQVHVFQAQSGSITLTPAGITGKGKITDSTTIAIGQQALEVNNLPNNLAIGFKALKNFRAYSENQGNTYNLAIGNEALLNAQNKSVLLPGYVLNTVPTFNLGVGHKTLQNNIFGAENLAVGHYALNTSDSSSRNTAVGNYAMQYSIGHNNTAVGHEALFQQTANESVAIGQYTLNYGGDRNTAVGTGAGWGNFIDHSGSGNVLLGYNAGAFQSVSNQLFIANSDTINPLIWGDFASFKLGFHGKVGIKTKNPVEILQIHDNEIIPQSYLRFSNQFSGNTLSDGFRIGLSEFLDGMIWHFENKPIKFGTNNSLRMTINEAGKVGIGISSISADLHIKSTGTTSRINLESSNTGINAGLALISSINESSVGIETSQQKRFRLRNNANHVITLWQDNRVFINRPTDPLFDLGNSLEVYDASTETASSIMIGLRNWASGSQAILRFGDNNHKITGTHSQGLEIYDVNKIKITGGNVGIGNSDPDTKLEVDGYTMLGSDAPKIKTKYFEENALTPATLRTATGEGQNTAYDLGISSTRILAVNIFVDYGSQPFTSIRSDDLVPPSYTATNGYQFDYVLNGNIIEIKNHPTNSENILGKYVRIFITYRE